MQTFPLATPNDPNAARPDHIVHPNRIARRLAQLKPNPNADGPIKTPIEVRLPLGRDSVRRAEMDAIKERHQALADASKKEAKANDAVIAQRRREVKAILDDKKATPAARAEAEEIIAKWQPQNAEGASVKDVARQQEENTQLRRIIAKHKRRAAQLGID